MVIKSIVGVYIYIYIYVPKDSLGKGGMSLSPKNRELIDPGAGSWGGNPGQVKVSSKGIFIYDEEIVIFLVVLQVIWAFFQKRLVSRDVGDPTLVMI